jgi:hypothetical protein
MHRRGGLLRADAGGGEDEGEGEDERKSHGKSLLPSRPHGIEIYERRRRFDKYVTEKAAQKSRLILAMGKKLIFAAKPAGNFCRFADGLFRLIEATFRVCFRLWLQKNGLPSHRP